MKLTLKQIIEWHIEDAEMSEINDEYDRGWYDCLKMVHKYVLENKLTVDNISYEIIETELT